jgi:hypothetical protein
MNTQEIQEVKFSCSDEDTEILKAIMDCNPRFDKEETMITMIVDSLTPIKSFISQKLKEQEERHKRETNTKYSSSSLCIIDEISEKNESDLEQKLLVHLARQLYDQGIIKIEKKDVQHQAAKEMSASIIIKQ